MKTLLTTAATLTAVAIVGLLTACGDSGNTGTNQATGAASSTATNWKLDAMPTGAKTVAALKADADTKAGASVVMTGVIGGRMEPISADSGLFVVMDPSIPSCAEMPDDHCETPWDYCCEAPESITANAATVQLRDASGNPINLAGQVKPLDIVTIVGTVVQRPNDRVLVVHAKSLYIAAEGETPF